MAPYQAEPCKPPRPRAGAYFIHQVGWTSLMEPLVLPVASAHRIRSTTTGCRWGSQVTHHDSSPAARRPGGRFLHGRNGHQAFQGGPLSTRDHPAPRFLLHHGPVIDGACASEDPSQPGRRIVHKMRRGLQAAFVLCRPLVTGPSPVRTIRFTTSPSATPEAGCIMPGMSPSDRTSFACLRDPRCGSTMPFGSGRHARSRTARR